MEAIKIFKGDDSDFMDLRTILFTIDAEFSLDDCAAEFKIQGYRELISDISSGSIEITLPSSQTRRMAPGECYGRLALIDGDGRKLTIINDLLFDIITDIDDIAQVGVSFTVEITVSPLVITLVEASPYVVSSGDSYTVTGYTPLTTLDMTDCTFEDLCNLTGTLLSTISDASMIGSESGSGTERTGDSYTVSGYTPITTLSLGSCSIAELANLVGGVIDSLDESLAINNGTSGGIVKTSHIYNVTNYNTKTSLDLSDCNLEELCDLLGSVIASLKKTGVIQ